MPTKLCILLHFLLCAALPASSAPDGDGGPSPADLGQMSLEDLMRIEVTSVARSEQSLADAAAAVYVVTQEEIRRSGLTSLAEVLRLVPGLEVAQIDANKWAVASRGFNGRFANKMLVLVDGRTVYTPFFAGVYWDVQDLMLEDVERIEVIRGPGASLWGANAVSGVINVITKSAEGTQGGRATGRSGIEGRDSGAARYGGRIGESVTWRAYGKYVDQDSLERPTGIEADDAWSARRAGVRLEYEAEGPDRFLVDASLYDENAGQTQTAATLAPPYSTTFNATIDSDGGHVLGRWTHAFSSGAESALQVYNDAYVRNEARYMERRDTYDLDFQHRLTAGARRQVVWGAGYRRTSDDVAGGAGTTFTQGSRVDDLFNAFLEDTLASQGGRVKVSLGARAEHNDYTGWEFQPSARLLWKPTEQQSVWTAVSRAVRTPPRYSEGLRADVLAFPGLGGMTNVVAAVGNEDLEAEVLLSVEAGYRAVPAGSLSLDVSLFYSDYEKLFGSNPGAPFVETSPAPAHVVIPMVFENSFSGVAYGGEASATWRPARWWRLSGSYSRLRMSLEPEGGGSPSAVFSAGDNPEEQYQIRSYVDLPKGFAFDAALYHVSALASGGLTPRRVPSYSRLDARLGWRPMNALEVSAGAQNLLDDRHLEFVSADGVVSSEVERTYFLRLSWRF